MDQIKRVYIDKIFEKKDEAYDGKPYKYLIHVVLNTICFNELLEEYLIIKDSYLKRSIEYNVIKRVEEFVNKESLYNTLYKKIETSDYKVRQRIRKIQFTLLPFLDKEFTEDFFYTYFNSRYINDIKSALLISGKVWNNYIENLILKEYNKSKDSLLLKTLIKNGDPRSILPILDTLWYSIEENYLKIEIIKRYGKEYNKMFDFLRILEPDKYLLVQVESKNKKEILNCYNNLTEESKVFGLLKISSISEWTFIENELKKYL